jgi:putative transposase
MGRVFESCRVHRPSPLNSIHYADIRRIIGFGVHQGDVDGPALCRMFNVAISKQNLPSYLSSDNDPLFLYHRWQANLRILEIDEVKSVPYTPISHPFVERLIGSIRREFLDGIYTKNKLGLIRLQGGSGLPTTPLCRF